MSVLQPTTTYQPPSFVVQIVTSALRHGLTVGAGFLVAHAILPQSQSDQFVQVGIALGLGALAYGWSLVEKRAHAADAARQVATANVVATVRAGQ